MAEDLVIIGSGPAGYTAAIYAGRARLKPLVFEGFQSGGIPGGQLMITTAVENFPAFPEGIQGPELMQRMRTQALHSGAELVTEDVVSVDFRQRPFRIATDEQEVLAKAVIVATGATAKRLHIPGEEIFWNNGISACAVCDGANSLFANGDLIVVGGGDTAAEEALYLTHYAKTVHLLVRSGQMRASQVMQERVFAHPKIQIHWHTQPISAHGNEVLRELVVLNHKTQAQWTLSANGMFYAIGHTPNTALFAGQIALDAAGYIVTHGKSTTTSVEGIWAAGDVQDHTYRQAITAAGTGCMAALEAERWLSTQNLEAHDQVIST